MGVEGKIAGRYLFSGKSRSVISWISGISAAGMAVGTAALIVILSVYNGFDRIIRDNLDANSPDMVVKPVLGKTFSADSGVFAAVAGLPGVDSAEGVLEETVATRYGDRQAITRIRGLEGAWQCSVSAALARELGIKTYFTDQLSLFFPSKSESFSMANPAASLETVRMRPKEVLNSDESFVIVPIAKARELLHIDSEVTAFEIYGSDASIRQVRELLGGDFEVLDKYQQHPTVYKMMRYEKAAIFAILFFVVLIVAFNIFGSLSMLIIDKTEDIATLHSIGMSGKMVRRTFWLEGWFVSLLGLVIGLAVGIALVLIQQHTGLVKMPGNYLVNSYPVVLKWTDALLTAAGVALIGALVSTISTRQLD
ncbi:MAG: ABC transporter permease [Bacteroidales bacterium]|nr:ABC transporter permease [Bacteroidales bacterium]